VTMRLLIMGLPGAGKGTQAKVVAARLDIPAISTGDIFRENVRTGTPLGLEANTYMDAGEYVPDELTNRLVADRLSQSDADGGFLLDGYPRTLQQVETLDGILASHGHQLDAVIQLTGVDSSEVADRLHKRAVSEGRADDSPDVIYRRLEIYERETAPLLDVYATRGLLQEVDGLGQVDEVTERVLKVLDGIERSTAGKVDG
jgi:adenylate kinase